MVDAFALLQLQNVRRRSSAFGIYLRDLQPDGLLLMNVSNRHLDVERVVAGSAARRGLSMRLLETPTDIALGTVRIRWALRARDQRLFDRVLQGAPTTKLHGTSVIWRRKARLNTPACPRASHREADLSAAESERFVARQSGVEHKPVRALDRVTYGLCDACVCRELGPAPDGGLHFVEHGFSAAPLHRRGLRAGA